MIGMMPMTFKVGRARDTKPSPASARAEHVAATLMAKAASRGSNALIEPYATLSGEPGGKTNGQLERPRNVHRNASQVQISATLVSPQTGRILCVGPYRRIFGPHGRKIAPDWRCLSIRQVLKAVCINLESFKRSLIHLPYYSENLRRDRHQTASIKSGLYIFGKH
jgi:hypothetical protein